MAGEPAAHGMMGASHAQCATRSKQQQAAGAEPMTYYTSAVGIACI